MIERRLQRGVVFLALTAALARLLPLQWLHPLSWDEIEFFRATDWIGAGLVPFRDFWEHHTPLAWFVYAPFTWLTDSPGVAAILVLRWAQVPVWIAAFWLTNLWMRDAGISRLARWTALGVALSSSFLMTSAIEFRIDPLGCLFYMAGLVLWRRGASSSGRLFAAGAMFCLAGLTNMRLGPLLVVTVLVLRFVREDRWKSNPRTNWIFAGGTVTLAVAMLYFVATDSLGALYRALLVENAFGDRYGQPITAGFAHRLLVPFGVRAITAGNLFEWAGIDVGGIALLLLGGAGLVLALRRWREPDAMFVLALLQATSIVVIARMNFIYNYHFQIVVLMLIPLIASVIDRITRRRLVYAVLGAAWCVNLFASVFRGKELDRAYQDFIMREVHARTLPGERVWSGIPWALRREPAYHFWFLPDMTRQLVLRGQDPPFRPDAGNPPAAVILDHYALIWIATVQRELAPYFVHHYMPVWRDLWVPAMNDRLEPGGAFEWIVPRDGTYRLFASASLAKHRWFREPLLVGSDENPDAMQDSVSLPRPAAHPALRWWIDAKPALVNGSVTLHKGQRLAVANAGSERLAVILLPGSDTALFRQPPPGATLEAPTARTTHLPRFGARIPQ